MITKFLKMFALFTMLGLLLQAQSPSDPYSDEPIPPDIIEWPVLTDDDGTIIIVMPDSPETVIPDIVFGGANADGGNPNAWTSVGLPIGNTGIPDLEGLLGAMADLTGGDPIIAVLDDMDIDLEGEYALVCRCCGAEIMAEVVDFELNSVSIVYIALASNTTVDGPPTDCGVIEKPGTTTTIAEVLVGGILPTGLIKSSMTRTRPPYECLACGVTHWFESQMEMRWSGQGEITDDGPPIPERLIEYAQQSEGLLGGEVFKVRFEIEAKLIDGLRAALICVNGHDQSYACNGESGGVTGAGEGDCIDGMRAIYNLDWQTGTIYITYEPC
jgi:hypothetical protein